MSESSPFDLLSGLASRARDAAIELPSVLAEQTHSTGLGFSLLGQRFIATMDEVNELMRLPPTTRIPGVKNFVLGVGNVRGRLMVVLDLALFFGQNSTIPRINRRVLAVEDDENLIGFVVDDSHGMQHFPSEAYSEQAIDVMDLFKDFVSGSYQVAGVEWPVLSIEKLARDPRLEKLALA